MNEYDYGHAALYDYFATGLEGDVQFYVEEAKKAGSPVLEIGCGTGRILIPMAESGITVVGLDRASAMLSIIRHKVLQLSMDTQSRATVVDGDMRNFSLGMRFNLILIPYRGINHLLSPEDQREALACMREHLTEDGHLIFNTFDLSLEDMAKTLGCRGTTLEKDSEFVHPTTGHPFIVWESRHYDTERQIIEQDYILEELDGEGRVLSKTYCPLIRRYTYRHEMQYLLEVCGYQVEALYGGFKKEPFHYGCEQVWIARRR